jgi:hypothetical protein
MELHHQAAAAVSITSRLLFGVSLRFDRSEFISHVSNFRSETVSKRSAPHYWITSSAVANSVSGAACDQAGNTTKAFAQVPITSKVNGRRMASLLEVTASPAPGDR